MWAAVNAGRMLGPAVAGGPCAGMGERWLCVVNAGAYAAVLVSLWLLRVHELHTEALPERTRGSLLAGFRYVWQRPDLVAVLVMLLLLGTFGFNFAIRSEEHTSELQSLMRISYAVFCLKKKKYKKKITNNIDDSYTTNTKLQV